MFFVSACLLGLKTRFNGEKKIFPLSMISMPIEKLIPICPEQLGGLSTPRYPAEIKGGSGEDVLSGQARVVNSLGEDITEHFLEGARQVQYLASLYKIEGAFLKDGSPSCGSYYTYDGTFTGKRILGMGVTAAVLKKEGIPLFTEKELFKTII